MRSIWSGALSFGLVNIPVKLYSASKERELSFHLLHKKDLSPIRYAKVCRANGEEVPYEEIVKGYEYSKGDYVIMEDEDFQKANPKRTKTIDITEFVFEKEIDPIYYDKPYFLEPDKGADKAYRLLREALRLSKKVAVAKYVLRNKEHLGVIRPYENIIVINQMRFQEEIERPDKLDVPAGDMKKNREIEMALKLIDQLTHKFKPEQFHDTYAKELKDVINRKAKGQTVKVKGQEPQTTTRIPDIMELLKESLQKQGKK